MGKSPSQRAREQQRAARLAEVAQAEQRRGRRRRLLAVVMVVAVASMLLAGLIGGFIDPNADERASTRDGEDIDTPSSVAPPVSITLPPPGETRTDTTECPAADGSSPRVTTFAGPPPDCLDPDLDYQAVITTSEGDIRVLLDAERAPITVNNFVVLARYHFYDGLPFYEIWPRQMVLTGDATGEPELGQGGPGYTIPDEIPEVGVIYPVGTVAMWNDVPGENGSRFLIATGEQATALPPRYTPFGLVLDGMDALNAIQFLGDPLSGQPIDEASIVSIAIESEPRAPETTATTVASTPSSLAATTGPPTSG